MRILETANSSIRIPRDPGMRLSHPPRNPRASLRQTRREAASTRRKRNDTPQRRNEVRAGMCRAEERGGDRHKHAGQADGRICCGHRPAENVLTLLQAVPRQTPRSTLPCPIAHSPLPRPTSRQSQTPLRNPPRSCARAQRPGAGPVRSQRAIGSSARSVGGSVRALPGASILRQHEVRHDGHQKHHGHAVLREHALHQLREDGEQIAHLREPDAHRQRQRRDDDVRCENPHARSSENRSR